MKQQHHHESAEMSVESQIAMGLEKCSSTACDVFCLTPQYKVEPLLGITPIVHSHCFSPQSNFRPALIPAGLNIAAVGSAGAVGMAGVVPAIRPALGLSLALGAVSAVGVAATALLARKFPANIAI